MNQTLTTFCDLFEKKLQLPNNSVCSECGPRYKNPLLPWIVGDEYFSTSERLIFVGKPHRGRPGAILESGVMDATEEIEGKAGLWNWGKAYWRYTKEIAETLYGEKALRSIAFSNLVKCSNTDDIDRTSREMAVNCITRLGVIWREFEVLKPKTAVFYTYGLFPDLLDSIPVAVPGTVRELTERRNFVPCGEKHLGWWDRSCETPWANELRILVVGHPERMAKGDYINRICAWVRPE